MNTITTADFWTALAGVAVADLLIVGGYLLHFRSVAKDILRDEKARYSLDDEQLGARANVTARTVRNDRTNPGGIPLERLLRYLGIELTGNDIVASIETAIAAKENDIR